MAAEVEIIFPDRPLGDQNAIDTVAELRALDSTDVNENTNVIVAAVAGIYKYAPSSLASDNGTTVIKPDDLTSLQAGRWLLIAFSSASLGFTQAGTGAEATTVQAKLREGAVSILDFRAAGAATDTVAFQEALATGKPIYFPGGQGTGASGVYLITTAASGSGYLTANTVLFGDGIGFSVIRPAAAGETCFRALSASAGTTRDNITFHDLTLFGYSASGFSEQIHLVALNGVRNVLFERCEFKAAQGDHVYLGTGETPGTGRHNYNVTFRDCVCDGVNNDNRAFLSVIDVDGLLIDGVSISNCTDSTMVGAINFEPDAADTTAKLRNITINNVSFSAIGGAIGTIAFSVPSAVVALPQGIRITNCYGRGYAGTGAEFFFDVDRALTAASTDSNITMSGCDWSGGIIPFNIQAGLGIVIDETNAFSSYTTNAVIGLDAGAKAWNITVKARMSLCGSMTNGIGIRVGTAENVLLDGLLYKCGGTGAGGFPAQFATGLTSVGITFGPNFRVVGNTSQTIALDNEGGAHTFTPAGNRLMIGANLGGLLSEFSATAPGQVLPPVALTWNPGSLIDGAGETSSAVTVTGAAFGDSVTVTAPYDLEGIGLTAYVSAADAVKARLQNESTATVDLASGSYTFTVTKKVV